MNFSDFVQKVHLNKVRHDEFLTVVSGYFGNLSFDSLPSKYIFEKRDNSNFRLELSVNREGEIVSLNEDNLNNEVINEIEQLILKNLVENQDEKICQVVLFSTGLKITGSFKYKESFQILPMPLDAPNINYIIGDHPFLLQYKYNSSQNSFVDVSRRKFTEISICQKLNLLTRGHIKHESLFSKNIWVLDKTLESGKLVSKNAQEGYYWPDHKPWLEAFQSINELNPFELVEPSEYYEYHGFKSQKNYCLLLPKNIAESLEKIEALSKKERMKFDLACCWFYHSRELWHDSQSSSFVALVTALESLFDKVDKCPACKSPIVENLEKCDVCNQPMFRITKTLKEFLSTYVPFIEKMQREKKMIYKIRSDLAHGSSMFSRDIEPGLSMSPIQQDQSQIHRNVYFIVLTAIYNWLWSR